LGFSLSFVICYLSESQWQLAPILKMMATDGRPKNKSRGE
jgi:hypothetical protein